ncbi:6-phosphofructokinase [beta proteobacterium AAP99]|nr:6-phosphofructokinase [beta proteobacterium AAP99]
MRVGILTGGGDCPGLNAVIRAVTKALIKTCGAEVIGIEDGYLGLIEQRVRPLDLRAVAGILTRGGTILGTHNAANPFNWQGRDVSAQCAEFARSQGLQAIVVIGGDGTMAISHKFSQYGIGMVGVPKTIDNDLLHTERTFGFDTAVAVVADALDRLQTTAQSHHRVMLVETMGRYAGWIALEAGLAGGADVILLPEVPYDIEAIAEVCRRREARQRFTLICVAEGAAPAGGSMTVAGTVAGSHDPVRLGGVANVLKLALEQRLTSEVRATILGHIQRGGTPTPFDRVLATQFGVHAAELVRAGQFNRLVVLREGRIASVPLADVAGGIRTVPLDHPLLTVARSIGVSLGVAGAPDVGAQRIAAAADEPAGE